MIISPLDEQRIKYINHLMDNIHDQSSEIYESLVDKDFNEANKRFTFGLINSPYFYLQEVFRDSLGYVDVQQGYFLQATKILSETPLLQQNNCL